MSNEKIKLLELDENNWYESCKLELTDEQKEYMEPNSISIAQTKFEPTLRAFAICYGNKIVGFAMFNTIEEELNSFWIYRIMIDKIYQRKGIGKVATKLIIDEMAKISKCQRIAVGFHHENTGVYTFYSKLGFIDRGDRFGKEKAVILDLV